MNAIRVYRLARFLHEKRVPLLPSLLRAAVYLIYNSWIPYTARIGEGSVFAYGGISVVVHSSAVIGRGCVIGQGITIGASEAVASPTPTRCPVIGDHVYIAAGARLLGDITIGDRCIIGANAVVTKSFPSGSIIAGVPARKIGETVPGYTAIVR